MTAIDEAAGNGHLDIVRYLHENGGSTFGWSTSRSLSGPLGHHLVKKICNDPELLVSHDLRLLYQSAIHTRDLELVWYLYDKLVDTKENDGGPWCELGPIDCDMAVFCGDRPTLDFIVEKIQQGRVTASPPFTKNVFEIAIGGARSCMIDPRDSNKETNKQIDAFQEELRIVSRLAQELKAPAAAFNALQVVLDDKLKGEMHALLERHKSKAGLDVAARLEMMTTGDPLAADSGPAEAAGGGGGDAMIGEQIAETEDVGDDDDGDDCWK
ncbi:hypothetical protein HK405_012984 [Cladochytrium tenue]|nr:hypothetical protein HK405_012984 [Cladochytrium tenue]